MDGTFRRNNGGQKEDSQDVSNLMEVLASEERRFLLYHLIEEADGSCTVEELTEELQRFKGTRHPSAQQPTFISLYHNHLPKLREAGIIEHDDSTGTVRYNGNGLLEDVLALTATRELTR